MNRKLLFGLFLILAVFAIALATGDSNQAAAQSCNGAYGCSGSVGCSASAGCQGSVGCAGAQRGVRLFGRRPLLRGRLLMRGCS
jgi:hypothetical protein